MSVLASNSFQRLKSFTVSTDYLVLTSSLDSMFVSVVVLSSFEWSIYPNSMQALRAIKSMAGGSK
jgi:hypothetical protein